MTIIYPPEYITAINQLLKEESAQFWDSITSLPAYSGLRINPLKTEKNLLVEGLQVELQPLAWADDGFQIPPGSRLGKHVFHAAGAYYLQEPSAMVPVTVLNPQPGDLVLDLCAAPGGKTTQIQSQMNNQGFLLANDANPRRVESLGRNVERWGSRNTSITCETPQRLTEHFGAFFDRVLVDAPCSGEGTFRAEPGEIKKWSINFTTRCGAIQDEILWFAGKLVRPGGILVYSTCTFNQHENEGSIERFLMNNPDFSLDSIPHVPGFRSGIPLPGSAHYDLTRTVRIWPHQATGEGHFIARLVKSGHSLGSRKVNETAKRGMDSDQIESYSNFFNTTMNLTPSTNDFAPGIARLQAYGNQLYLVPPHSPSLEGLRVHHWGWWLGTFKTDQFIPSPALASGITREDSQKVLEFPVDDPGLKSYLRGSPIRSLQETGDPGKWVLICVGDYSLGWGKIITNQLKSYLPSWLRTN